MFLANFYFRALLLSLVSVGLVVPAWATQPCRCSEKGCCSQDSDKKSSCCSKKPCCAAQSDHQQILSACGSFQSVGCPCCADAPAPTTTAPKQNESTQQDHASVVFAPAPAVLPPDLSTAYLVRELGSPPGHPSLRLHALYRVWLN